MNLREPGLPAGWYPRQKDTITEFMAPFAEGRAGASALAGAAALAAIAPHAGWYYSGSVAALAAASLAPDAEAVAVIGGHLPRGMPVLAAGEDGVKTPLGVMAIDTELRAEFERQVSLAQVPITISSDRYQDNTVEVLLPMVRYLFPEAALLWLRFPAELSSFEAGKALARAAAAVGRRLAVLASTDLTHYGDNYGFSPRGRGKAALDWVKEVNDAAFIDAVLAGDPALVLKRAEEDGSACSVGAVLGALGFAASGGASASPGRARLLEYRTSADVAGGGDEVPSSFVGYAAISLG